MQRIADLASEHPGWATQQPFRAVLENDQAYLAHLTIPELLELAMATHGSITQSEFSQVASTFFDTATHPRFGVRYTEMVYQPMLELLDLLHDNDFKVFIRSGGGIEFIRTFSEDVYNIPRENVIGSSIKYTYEETADGSRIQRLPEIGSINDKAVKPANIQLHIGRRPIMAVGNSDGDLQMMLYTDDGEGPSLQVLLHHDDTEREYDYDHGTEHALEVAAERGWQVVSIKDDFKTVFAFELE